MNTVNGEDKEYYDVILEDDEGNIRPRKAKAVDPKKIKETGWKYVGLAGQIGFDIALPMVIGLIAGTKLDELWGTRPKVALLLFTVGLFFGCMSLLRIVKEMSRK